MENVVVLDEPALKCPENFKLSQYLNSTLSMFSGKSEEVKLRFDKSLINPVIDRFGKNIIIAPDGENHFIVRVQIKTEHPEPFFGWLFQFGTKVQIVEPCKLREQYIAMLKNVLQKESE